MPADFQEVDGMDGVLVRFDPVFTLFVPAKLTGNAFPLVALT